MGIKKRIAADFADIIHRLSIIEETLGIDTSKYNDDIINKIHIYLDNRYDEDWPYTGEIKDMVKLDDGSYEIKWKDSYSKKKNKTYYTFICNFSNNTINISILNDDKDDEFYCLNENIIKTVSFALAYFNKENIEFTINISNDKNIDIHEFIEELEKNKQSIEHPHDDDEDLNYIVEVEKINDNQYKNKYILDECSID